MTSASDAKWRPFSCFFSRVWLRTYQHPCMCVFWRVLYGNDRVGRKWRPFNYFFSRVGLRTYQHPCINKIGNVYTKRNIEERSCSYRCSTKAISITYFGYVFVDLGTQHAMRMRHIVICSLSGSTIIFPTLSHKRHDFRENVTEHKMCVLISSTTFV